MNNRNSISGITVVVLLLSLAFFIGAGTSPVTNEYVKSTISVKEKSIKAGTRGTLLISLVPKKGIHINLTPPIVITLDSASTIEAIGKLGISKIDSFLNPLKPIEQSIQLSKKIKPGSIDIKGIITYYYCSDAEGWCSRFKQPFSVTVKVTK